MQKQHGLEPWAVVAHILEQAVTRLESQCGPNSRIFGLVPLLENNITCFDGRRPPSISIYDYLFRIKRFSNCSSGCYISALVYIDRLLQKKPEFALTRLNIHRIIISGLLLAIKFSDDFFYPNSYYATIGGLSVNELNRLELAMLFLIQFDLVVDSNVFSHYIDHLKSTSLRLVCQELSAVQGRMRRNTEVWRGSE